MHLFCFINYLSTGVVKNVFTRESLVIYKRNINIAMNIIVMRLYSIRFFLTFIFLFLAVSRGFSPIAGGCATACPVDSDSDFWKDPRASMAYALLNSWYISDRTSRTPEIVAIGEPNFPVDCYRQRSFFLALAPEHILEILAYVSKDAIGSTALTCKLLYNAIPQGIINKGNNHGRFCQLENIKNALMTSKRNIALAIHKQSGLDSVAPFLTNIASLCLGRLFNMRDIIPENSVDCFDIGCLPPNPYLEELTIERASPLLDFFELAEKFPNLRSLRVFLNTDDSNYLTKHIDGCVERFESAIREHGADSPLLNADFPKYVEFLRGVEPSVPLDISTTFCKDLKFLEGLIKLNHLEMTFPICSETTNIDCLTVPPLKHLTLCLKGDVLAVPVLPSLRSKTLITERLGVN